MTHISTTTSGKNRKITFIFFLNISFSEDESFDAIAVTTANEAIPLIEEGFIYETTTPDGFMLYKKRK